MSLATIEIIRALKKICAIEEMKVTVDGAINCGLISFLGTVAGALMGGSKGVLVGGMLGAVGANYYAGSKNLKSVAEVLENDLTKDQQETVANAIKDIMTLHGIMSLLMFIQSANENPELMSTVRNTVSDCLGNLGYKVTNVPLLTNQ